jgi:hypothetical protein
MKEEDIYKTYMLESGIGAIVRDHFMKFATHPLWHEVDNIRISNNKLYFAFMNPKNNNNFIEVNSNILFDNSNLMWTHDKPSIINSSIMDITHAIYIVRDGRSVVNSMINYVTSPTAIMANPKYNITDSNDIFNNDKLFASYVNAWSNHIDSYMRNKNRYLLIKAEYLKSYVSKAAKDVCEYMEIDVNLTNIKSCVGYEVLSKQAPNHLFIKKNKWQDNFSKRNVEIFKDLAGDNLINMGYVKDNKW